MVSYSNGKLVTETASGKHTLKMIHPLLFEDESGTKVTFKKNAAGHIAYMYSTGLPDLVAFSEKLTWIHLSLMYLRIVSINHILTISRL